MNDSKLFRAVVRKSPECIYIAQRPVKLHVWVCDKTAQGDEADPIFVSDISLEDIKKNGNQMPFNAIVPIQLMKNGCLYVRTRGDTETFLNVSIEYL